MRHLFHRRAVVVGIAAALLAAIAIPAFAVGAGPGAIASRRHADASQDRALMRHLRRGPRGPRGATGRRGPAGGRRGPAGRTGPAGPAGTARAYGLVSASGALNTTRSLNASVTHTPGSGIYCVALAAGVDPAKTLAVATLDDSAATANAKAAVNSASPICGAGKLQINTATQTVSGTTITTTPTDEGFFFAVP